jgi:UDP-N-acetylglucosamine transferase subunit ALG13
MIFVTVGSEPFDRLIQALDRWVAANPDCEEVFAQIADANYQPTHFRYVAFLSPNEYRGAFQRARFVISHAGTGTIITALELRKPIVVMPRKATLRETRNEHQLATVRHFQKYEIMRVADSEEQLPAVLEATLRLKQANDASPAIELNPANYPADPALIRFVRDFVS